MKKKNPLNTRDFLWRAIRLYVARASMASWGLPFEAIAASMLLRDRYRKRKRHHPRASGGPEESDKSGFPLSRE